MMNSNQLHITNGDCAAEIIKASSLGGDVLPWRDPMHHGPFPTNLDLDTVGNIRAEYLAGNTHNVDDVRLSFRLRNEKLRAASTYGEVILWFEHDLLDQLQILELLNWFCDADLGSTVLTMICINEFPDVPNFRGIGELNSEQVATLFPTRALITPEQMRTAKSAWTYFGLEDPRHLEKYIRSTTLALPFLNKALQRYFQEFPWVGDGLTRTERQILHLVSSGIVKPVEMFVENMAIEDAIFIGDWSTYRLIARFCSMKTPLLSCLPDKNFRYLPGEDITTDLFHLQTLSLTETGEVVLAGTRSARTLIVRDEWLGGVHLNSVRPIWMWDSSASQLVLA